MKLYRKIDPVTQLFIEDVPFDDPPTLDDGMPDPLYIETPVPPDAGFILPRWNPEASAWEEGGTPPEPVTPEPTEVEALRALVTQTSADFQAFMDFYFTANPE